VTLKIAGTKTVYGVLKTPYVFITLSMLAVIFLTCIIFSFFHTIETAYFYEISGISIIYLILMSILNDREGSFSLFLRAITTVAVCWAIYFVMSKLPFDVVPYNSDTFLARLDQLLGFGTAPVLWAEKFVNSMNLNFFSFVYAVFIPFMYYSIFISLLGRQYNERKVFITAFVVTYAISFMGHLFLPARGPIVFYASDFSHILSGGGYFHKLVVDSIDKAGGPHGAFPSLHVGVTWFVCYFDLKFNRIRGLLYLPLVVLIIISTVLLRYHYVIDLIAGVAIGTFSVSIATKLAKK